MKICSKCQTEKLLKEFYKNKAQKDGFCNYCKKCHTTANGNYSKIYKSKIAKRRKIYFQNNKSKFCEYYRNRRKTDPYYKLVKNLRRLTLIVLKGKSKSAPTEKLLGCSFQQFNNYFKSKMTPDMSWQDYLDGKIHIDHIRPVSSFDLTDPAQQRICFNYMNLQPLWAKDNLSKKDKIIIYPTTSCSSSP